MRRSRVAGFDPPSHRRRLRPVEPSPVRSPASAPTKKPQPPPTAHVRPLLDEVLRHTLSRDADIHMLLRFARGTEEIGDDVAPRVAIECRYREEWRVEHEDKALLAVVRACPPPRRLPPRVAVPLAPGDVGATLFAPAAEGAIPTPLHRLRVGCTARDLAEAVARGRTALARELTAFAAHDPARDGSRAEAWARRVARERAAAAARQEAARQAAVAQWEARLANLRRRVARRSAVRIQRAVHQWLVRRAEARVRRHRLWRIRATIAARAVTAFLRSAAAEQRRRRAVKAYARRLSIRHQASTLQRWARLRLRIRAAQKALRDGFPAAVAAAVAHAARRRREAADLRATLRGLANTAHDSLSQSAAEERTRHVAAIAIQRVARGWVARCERRRAMQAVLCLQKSVCQWQARRRLGWAKRFSGLRTRRRRLRLHARIRLLDQRRGGLSARAAFAHVQAEREAKQVAKDSADEERRFRKAWRAYDRRMTAALCRSRLGDDWIPQNDPVTGITTFFNIKTGKTSSEHPNMALVHRGREVERKRAHAQLDAELQKRREVVDDIRRSVDALCKRLVEEEAQKMMDDVAASDPVPRPLMYGPLRGHQGFL